MKLLRLAWRNVLRNVRRSLITVAAITIGLTGFIFNSAFIDGINEQMIENSTSYVSGHLRVHKKGFHKDKPLHLAMTDDPVLRAKVTQTPHVQALSPRVEGKALLSGARKSSGVMVVGIDPGLEPRVTTINKTIVRGRYLQAGDGDTILIGDKVAEALKLSLGDDAVLITQAVDGSIGAGRYRVVGIFDTGIDVMDAAQVFLPLEAARDLYSLWGQVTAWVVRLDERRLATTVAQQLSQTLGKDYEVLGWRKLLSSIVQMVQFHDAIGYIILIIVFVVVTVGVANTILMAVMERTREFGVMMALGTSRGQIVGLVIIESLLLGLAGLVLGNLLGIGLIIPLTENGLDLGQYTEAMEAMPGLSGIVYPFLRLDHMLLISSLVFLIALVPALYPAWRAGGVEPVEAIRGIRSRSRRWYRPRREPKPAGRTRAVFWAIAGRGILRNPRRSLLTASATAFGLAAFVFLYAFAEGFFEQMIKNSTGYFTAHVQLEQKGFRTELEPALRLQNPDMLLRAVEKDPRVQAATARVQTQAMISSPTRSEPLILLGVDPEREQAVTVLHKVVTQGAYLLPQDRQAIVIGKRLARQLKVRLGEKVVVMAQQVDGDLGSAAYRITGIFDTGNEFFDGLLGLVPLAAGQELLGMGSDVSTIALALKDRHDSEAVATALNTQFDDQGYDAVSWETMMPVVVQMIDFTRVDFYVVLGVVFIVVAMGVMNTLLMSVLERTREFGVMMALGTEPGQVLRVVMYESLLLGLIGVVAGLILGMLLVAWYATQGMDLTGFMGATETIPGMTAIIRPILLWANTWWPMLVLFITSIAAAAYPAMRAARLEPVTAIRHV